MPLYQHELYHHGILGQKWGIRRFQNEDGSLTDEGRKRYGLDQNGSLDDEKWARKYHDTIYKDAYQDSVAEMNDFIINDLNKRLSKRTSSGRISLTYINEYNKKLAEVMTKNAESIPTPSGKVIKFVAKRGGEVGAMFGYADAGYDMSQVKRGVYSDGRIAYKQNKVGVLNE